MKLKDYFKLFRYKTITDNDILNFFNDGYNINDTDEYGYSLLINAVYWFNIINIKLILKYNPNLNIQNISNDSALILSTIFENLEICNILLKQGANPYLLNNEGKSAYDYSKNKEIKQLFLNNCLYFNNKMLKKIIRDKIINKEILNIKKINIPLNKLI